MQRFMAFLAGLGGCSSLALRLIFAEIVIVAGYRKFFVMGLGTVTTNFEKFGIPLPQIMGPVIGLLELIGGAMIAVGFLTRYLGVLFTCEFIVATWGRWVAAGEGYGPARIDTLLAVVAFVLATQGGGSLSADAKMGRR